MQPHKLRKNSSRNVPVDRAARAAASFAVEGLEKRVFLSSALPIFAAQQTYATGETPRTVAVTDVNGDGKADLLVANKLSNTMGVLLGNGNGTFAAQQTFATGTRPYSGAVADVNGDGKLDAVIVNEISGNVGVLLGNGNGTFQAQATIAVGTFPTSVAVTDLNGDGRADLVVSNYSNNTVGVLLGNGNGTFKAQQTFAGGAGPIAVAQADVNGDGKPDLVVADKTGLAIGVLLGNGDGSLQAIHTFAAGTGPFSLAVADVNGDGKLDIAACSYTATGVVSVLLGNGNGTFQAQQTFATGGSPTAIVASDINADGKPDIVVANGLHSSLSVLLGNGNGTFKPQTPLATGINPFSLSAVDVNADGRLDLVVADDNHNAMDVLLADLPPTVLSINCTNPVGPLISESTVAYTVTFSESVAGVDATDFSVAATGVSASPTVVVTPVSGSVYTVTINGITGGNGTVGLNLIDDGSIKNAAGNPLQAGGVASFLPQAAFGAGTLPSSVATGDVNGDGKVDLVVTNSGNDAGGNSVSVLLGNGNGTFKPQATFLIGMTPHFVTIADVSGDGKPDLIVLNYGTSTVNVLLGNGNGTFKPQVTFATAVVPYFVQVADVNGDGKPDLVVANYTGLNGNGKVCILLGNGNGTFLPQQLFAAGAGPKSLAVADVTGDGKPDLIVAHAFDNTVGLLVGNGNGTFQPQQNITTSWNPTNNVIALDVNADGKLDLVVEHFYDAAAGVLLGNGNGTFKPETTFATGFITASMIAADMNGDLKPDLVFAYQFGNSATVLLGNGNGTFQAPFTFAAGTNPVAVSAADLNGDGKADLIVANHISYNVSVLLGTTNVSGLTYTVVPSLDTFTGSTAEDQIGLVQDPDHVHIDWTANGTQYQMPIADANGLTLNGVGNLDDLYLDYTNGNPLPNKLNLYGYFVMRSLASTGNPLANTTIDLKGGVLEFQYSGAANDPISLIQGYLKNGYNGGAWTGSSPNGVIRSSSAAATPLVNTLGYADAADFSNPAHLPTGLIEIVYTAIGDTNLDGTVGLTDLAALLKNFNTGTQWDQGDITYGVTTGLGDLAALLKHFNNTATYPAALPDATPAAHAAVMTPIGVAPVTSTPMTSNDNSSVQLAVGVAPTEKHKAKADKGHKKRR